MIGRLSGRIGYRGSDHVLLDVGGVGYVVHVSERTLAQLPGPGEAAILYTELLVREDLMQLIGFTSLQEKEWHRLLTSVQGVGAKAALAILGTLGADGLSRAITLGDWAAIKAAPGVGPKIAQRVAMELKAKAPAMIAMAGAHGPAQHAPTTSAGGARTPEPAPAPLPATEPEPSARASADALSALVNLGYGEGDAATAVARAAAAQAETGAPPETPMLIRAALRLLAPSQ